MGLIEHELGNSRINYGHDAFTGGSGSENLDGYKKLGEFPVEKGPTLVLRKGMRDINLAWETPHISEEFLTSLRSLRFTEAYGPPMLIIETMKQGIMPLIFDLHELDVYFDGVSKLDPHQKELFKTDRISIRTDAEDLTWQQVVTESGTTNIASIRKTSPKADITLATFYGYTTGVWLPDQVIAQIEANPAYNKHIEEITNPESTPINPIQISEEDKILLKAHISTESRILPGSYFLKSSFKTVSWEEGDSIFQSGSSERDISYLVPYCLGITEIDAIRLIMEAHELQPDEARAAWVFVNRYPISSLAITAKNTPEYVDQMAQRVTQESNPRTELSI